MNQKKLANLGLFAAVAIIFGYVESLIPFFAGIPGMKLGLANLAVLFSLKNIPGKKPHLFLSSVSLSSDSCSEIFSVFCTVWPVQL